jgi:transcriptional regulator with XRE-family HTH domain
MLFSERILQGARIMAGLTQAQLAEAAGVGESVIADIERGTSDPRNSTLMRIVDVLSVHGVQLVGFGQGVLGGALIVDRRDPRLAQPIMPLAAEFRSSSSKERRSRGRKKTNLDRIASD